MIETAGGCIRLYATGPEWHVNSRHATVGFQTSETTTDEGTGLPVEVPVNPVITPAGDLFVTLLTNLDVVSAIASPDETLTARGITAGVSGGVSSCTIRFHHVVAGRLDLNDPEHYSLVSGDLCNLWLHVARVAGTEAG